MLDDGSCPAEEFLSQLSELDIQKMKATFDLFVASSPRPLSREKFKKIEGTDLYEFKCFQVRMPCFYAGQGRIILTHGLKKKADKLRPSDIKKAQELKGTFERRTGKHG